jgi:hypothetical protein
MGPGGGSCGSCSDTPTPRREPALACRHADMIIRSGVRRSASAIVATSANPSPNRGTSESWSMYEACSAAAAGTRTNISAGSPPGGSSTAAAEATSESWPIRPSTRRTLIRQVTVVANYRRDWPTRHDPYNAASGGTSRGTECPTSTGTSGRAALTRTSPQVSRRLGGLALHPTGQQKCWSDTYGGSRAGVKGEWRPAR